MTHRAVLAVCLACAAAPLTISSSARADEVVLSSTTKAPAAGTYRLEPILGLDPLTQTSRLTMPVSRSDLVGTPTPKKILATEDKAIVLVAAAIVGVVFVIAVLH